MGKKNLFPVSILTPHFLHKQLITLILHMIKGSFKWIEKGNKRTDSYSIEILELLQINMDNYVLLNYVITLCSRDNWSQ